MSSKPKGKAKPKHLLATAEEIRHIFARLEPIADAIEALEDDYDDDTFRAQSALSTMLVEGARFCGYAAGLLGDPTLIDVIVGAFEWIDGYESEASEHPVAIAEGLTELLEKSGLVDDQVRALAAHEEAVVRAAVASGLAPSSPAAVALLERLATDTSPEVRRAANERLGPEHAIAWWAGKFRSDPTARLAPADRERLEAPLRTIADLMSGSKYEIERNYPAIAKAAAQLPDDLSVEVCEQILAGSEDFAITRQPSILLELISRRGGDAALVRMIERIGHGSDSHFMRTSIVDVLAKAPENARDAVVTSLLDFIRGAPPEGNEFSTPASLAAEIVAKAWPRGRPAAALLPVFEARFVTEGTDEKRAFTHTVSLLTGVLKDGEASDIVEVARRMADAFVTGEPRWLDDVARRATVVFDRLPDGERRVFAERALRSASPGANEWGIRQIVGPSFDPARDGSPAELAARLHADEHLRAKMENEHAELLLPILRKGLRDGRLSFEAAVATVRAIRKLWPENDEPPKPLRPHFAPQDPKAAERERKKHLKELGPFLGGKDLRGPMTSEEWVQYRRIRDAKPKLNHLDWVTTLGLLPEKEPRCDADQRFIERAVEETREGNGALPYGIAHALMAAPRAGDLEICEELLRIGEPFTRSEVRMAKKAIRAALGLPPEPSSPDAEQADEQRPSDDLEWMDRTD